jgi:hypothetical protein
MGVQIFAASAYKIPHLMFLATVLVKLIHTLILSSSESEKTSIKDIGSEQSV